MKRAKGKWGFLVAVILAAAIMVGALSYATKGTAAQAKAVKEIKVACVFPMSGALSRNGNLFAQSTKAAIGWVNDNGGIKSMGGAKLVPVIADAGGTVEGSATAMERVCRDPDIKVAQDGWASAFNMSSTEVTERLGIPQFNVGFADALHERGFKWGFYVVAPNSTQGEIGVKYLISLAKSFGQDIKTVMLVGDNQAGSRGYYNAAKKIYPMFNVKVIGEETWPMGTLTDATSVMQKVKTLDPDLVALSATAISEFQMCMMKRKELGIKIPFIGGGGYALDPSFRVIGKDALEGVGAFTPAFANKLTPKDWIQRSLAQCKKEYSDEPYMSQELGWAWATIPPIALVLEKAGSVNNEAIRNAALKLDVHDSIYTRYLSGQGLAFGPNGRIAMKYRNVMLAQWQDGTPQVIFPENLATAKPRWVFKKK